MLPPRPQHTRFEGGFILSGHCGGLPVSAPLLTARTGARQRSEPQGTEAEQSTDRFWSSLWSRQAPVARLTKILAERDGCGTMAGGHVSACGTSI